MFKFRRALLVVAGLFVTLPAFGQRYPLPSTQPVICTSCLPPYTNLPTWPISPPLKAFAGRFLDTQATKDFQTPPRTYRALYTVVVPERNRVYMVLGSTFAAYDLSTFFTTTIRQPLTQLNRLNQAGSFAADAYQPFGSFVDSEQGGGWIPTTADGQERLYTFDYDDRGFVYLAYSTNGWGIVRDDRSPQLPLVRQITQPGITPTRILSLKTGGRYYALVSNHQGDGTLVYDVTNASSPQLLRTLSIGFKSAASSGEQTAVVTSTSSLRIYTTANLVAGAAPITTAGGAFVAVTTDGFRFMAAVKDSPQVGIFRPAAGGFDQSNIASATALSPVSIRFSGNFLTLSGYDSLNRSDVRLFQLQGTSFVEIPLGAYFPSYYPGANSLPPPGFAKQPGTYMDPRDAVTYSAGTKDYLIYSGTGMGDVYEFQTGDTIRVSFDRSVSFGTANPNSTTRGQGPFYGDLLTFTSSSTTPRAILWNFGNPEAGSSNTTPAQTGQRVTYRYSSLTSAAAAGAPKSVTAVVTTDSANTDTTSVTMTAPVARMGLAGTTQTFTDGTLLSLVLGEELVDASDGTVEGHFSQWISGTSTTRLLPTTPFAIRQCGTSTLSLEARYSPYTVSANVPVPSLPDTAHLVSTVRVNLESKAMAARVELGPSDLTSTTFVNRSRLASLSTFAQGGSTPVTAKWSLLSSTGSVISTRTNSLTAATVASDSFSVARSSITRGSRVTLELTLGASALTDATCSRPEFLTSAASFALPTPDPRVSVSGCTFANGTCQVSADSITSQTQLTWTYEWKVNGTVRGTGRVFNPAITAPGTYTISVIVSSPFGNAEADVVVNVGAAECRGVPSGITISAVGQTTGCVECLTNEPMIFTPRSFSYAFQECDRFEWTFGDGTPNSTERNPPSHRFPAAGPFTVTLRVSNSNGNATGQTEIFFGPPIAPCRAPSNVVTPSYSGPVTSCRPGVNCRLGELIQFSTALNGYTFQQCDLVDWNFGDGTPTVTAPTPTKAYTRAGTFTVTMTLRNRTGVATPRTVNIVIADVPCTGAPAGSLAVLYRGATSRCDNATANSNCANNEVISFEAQVAGYTVQACDTFEWDFGDSTPLGTGARVDHRYTQNGFFQAKVTLKNRNGEKVSAPASIGVTPTGGTRLPVPDFSVVGQDAFAAVPVQFIGTPGSGDTITTWRWNFGDGTTGTGQTVTHTYPTAGTFSVTLIVANAQGDSGPRVRSVTVSDNPPFAFIVPVIAHLPGGNGSFFKSDIQFNSTDPAFSPTTPLRLELEFNGIRKTLELNSSTYIYEDFVRFFTQADTAGPLTIRGLSKFPPRIRTRTYAVASSGTGTFGQTIPAFPLRADIEPGGTGPSVYYLSGLRVDTAFRTNIGMVNASQTSFDVKLEVFDIRGRKLGEISKRLNAGQLTPVNNIKGEIPAIPATEPFTLRISNAEGRTVFAYASMIDNRSSDPVTILATSDAETRQPLRKNIVLPGVGDVNSFRSDVTIFNPDSLGIQVDIAYFDTSGTKLAEARDIAIGANGLLQIDRVLRAGILIPALENSFGLLKIDTKTAGITRYPVVFARTYSDQPTGTFGQGIPAVVASAGNVSTGKPGYIVGVRNDSSYTTNVFLVNLSAGPAIARVQLLDRNSGREIGQQDFALNPNQTRSFPNAMASINPSATEGTIKVLMLSGGPVHAFGSILDRRTTDPEYVAAESGD